MSQQHAHESVLSARIREGTGCIEVDHDTGDLEELLAGLQADLRGWQRADNGERVIVDLQVHDSGECPFGPSAGPV